MLPNLKELTETYESFDDSKLIRLATEEAAELRPEAVELLKQIIKERGLSEDILKGIDVQIQGVDDEKLLEYAELLRRLPCPVCRLTNEKLNATMTGIAISLFRGIRYIRS